MTLRWPAFAAGVLLAAAQPGATPAQSLIMVSFGENTDATSSFTSGQTASLAYARILGEGGVSLAAGLPTDLDSGTRWASAVGWLETGISGPFGADGILTGFAYRDPVLAVTGTGASGTLHATADLQTSGARLRFRAGARIGALEAGQTSLRRGFPGAGSEVTFTRGPLRLTGALDAWAADGEIYPLVRGTLGVGGERVRATGSLSHWLHDALPETGWSAGVELRLSEWLTGIAHASRAAVDILFWTPPQRSWGVGLRASLGGRPEPAVLAPAVVPAGRSARFRLAASEAVAGPGVAGSFSDWEPIPMQRDGDDWVLELTLEPGIHEFAFVAADGSWFVPEETPGRKPDGYGGFIATLVVR